MLASLITMNIHWGHLRNRCRPRHPTPFSFHPSHPDCLISSTSSSSFKGYHSEHTLGALEKSVENYSSYTYPRFIHSILSVPPNPPHCRHEPRPPVFPIRKFFDKLFKAIFHRFASLNVELSIRPLCFDSSV